LVSAVMLLALAVVFTTILPHAVNPAGDDYRGRSCGLPARVHRGAGRPSRDPPSRDGGRRLSHRTPRPREHKCRGDGRHDRSFRLHVCRGRHGLCLPSHGRDPCRRVHGHHRRRRDGRVDIGPRGLEAPLGAPAFAQVLDATRAGLINTVSNFMYPHLRTLTLLSPCTPPARAV
ncbi:hypothetical protein C8R44DRAFT_794479, partial [Mycena epipterygia]